jgi:hypothetical protein
MAVITCKTLVVRGVRVVRVAVRNTGKVTGTALGLAPAVPFPMRHPSQALAAAYEAAWPHRDHPEGANADATLRAGRPAGLLGFPARASRTCAFRSSRLLGGRLLRRDLRTRRTVRRTRLSALRGTATGLS